MEQETRSGYALTSMNSFIHSLIMSVFLFVEFVVIHNGIITNYKELKAFLVSEIFTVCTHALN